MGGGGTSHEGTPHCRVCLPSCLCVCECALTPAKNEGRAEEEDDGLLRLLSRAISGSFRWLRLPPESIPHQAENRVRAACCFWPEDDLHNLTDRVRCPERHAEWLPSVITHVGMNTDITPLLIQCAAMRVGVVIEPIVPPVLALWAADLEGGWGPLAWCIHPGPPWMI